MRQLINFLGLGLLAGCADAATADAEKAVRATLLDPQSAQFEDVERCGSSDIVTGKVNSKNIYGGYVGSRPFVAQNGMASVFKDDNTKTFIRLMNECAKAIIKKAEIDAKRG